MKKNIKLYNLVFPIWLLWLIPLTWIVVMPINFLVDITVTVVTMKILQIQNKKQVIKDVIIKTWILGFVADLIGAGFMLLSNVISFNHETELGKWWYKNIEQGVSYYPFSNIFSILWIVMCIMITAELIYVFNYKICYKNLDIDETKKKKMAIALAFCTAPYTFFVPTSLFY